MDKNKVFFATHSVLLSVLTVLITLKYAFDGCNEDGLSFAVLVIAIALDIVSMGYFIIQDIVDNERKLAKHGSLSLFDTVDRKNLVNNVKELIQNREHVIYINCKNLPDIETENIKQRLYNDLSLSKKTKEIQIKNVFMPISLDMETFYEQIFFNRPANKRSKKINVYIYDKHTANYYFIKQIERKFNDYFNKTDADTFESIDKRKKMWAKNSFIVYLCDDDTPGGIKTSIDNAELAEIIESKTGKTCPHDRVEKMNMFDDINKVLIIDEILNDDFNKTIIKDDMSMIYVFYYLKTGKYSKALDILADKNVYTGKKFDSYKNYVIADTLHLLNCYANASSICYSIMAETGGGGLLYRKAVELNAHIMKHIGFFDDADYPGKDVFESSSNKLLDCLGNDEETLKFIKEKKTINNYFSRLKKILEKNAEGISKDTKYTNKLAEIFAPNKNPDTRMYYAAFSAYNNLIEADKCIDDLIEFYEKTDNRRRFNAYYVKAEILRKKQKYAEAYGYYMRSSGVEDGHVDVNLLDQNYFSLKALEKLGLAQGTGSLCVKNYKARFFTPEGFRLDESSIENKLRNYDILEKDEKTCLHAFNNALLFYIDDNTVSEEQLCHLLDENIFLIL